MRVQHGVSWLPNRGRSTLALQTKGRLYTRCAGAFLAAPMDGFGMLL
jgi:hypothetical protein